MTLVTSKAPERTAKPLPEAIAAAILSGDIAHEIRSSEIGAKASPTGKDESAEYDGFDAVTLEGAQILSGGKIDCKSAKPESGKDERSDEDKRLGLLDHFNYGFGLALNRAARIALETSLAGPEKAVKANALKLFKSGFADSLSDAIDVVVAQGRKNGKLPADYEYTGDRTE